MTKLHHKCNECDSEFTLLYDENACEDDPSICPFCSSYIIKEDDESSDDYDEDDE